MEEKISIKCSDHSGHETQAEMNIDSYKILSRTLDKLEDVLYDLKRIANIEEWELFEKAQNIWEIFVRTELLITEKQYLGGSIAPLMINMRHNDLVEVRIRDLRKHLN